MDKNLINLQSLHHQTLSIDLFMTLPDALANPKILAEAAAAVTTTKRTNVINGRNLIESFRRAIANDVFVLIQISSNLDRNHFLLLLFHYFASDVHFYLCFSVYLCVVYVWNF